MKLNTEEWKKFRIGDWFEVLSSNKIYHAANLHIEDKPKNDYYPYVVRSAQNRGIKGYIKKPIEFLNSENTISFAQDTFFAFYQEKPYFTGNNVKILKPLFEYSRNILLFIETSINKSMLKNTWGMGSGKEYVENIEILLPSKDNEPDWAFMEEYIKEIEEKYIEKVDEYNQENIQKALDVIEIAEDELDKDLIIKPADRYEEFSVKSLFKLIPSQNYIDRNKISDVGRTKVYSSTTSDYGLMGYIDEDPYFLINEKNPYYIIFGDHTREFNFVYNSFSTTDNVKVLSPINKSKLTNLYILTLWKKHIPELGYSRHWSKAKNVVLKLPAIDEKTPDFEYMEKAIYIYTKKVIKSWQLDNEKEIRALISAINKQK